MGIDYVYNTLEYENPHFDWFFFFTFFKCRKLFCLLIFISFFSFLIGQNESYLVYADGLQLNSWTSTRFKACLWI